MTIHSNKTPSATSTSRLCTSRTTPFIQKKVRNGASLLISNDEKCAFSSCKFRLKKHLGELAQFKMTLQFGRAHQPAKTNP
jgi:hypothetical protein